MGNDSSAPQNGTPRQRAAAGERAAAHITLGEGYLMRANLASPRQARKFCMLAAGHFDAARVITEAELSERNRQMYLDMKSSMAGVADAFSRLPGMSEGDSPFGPFSP